MGRLISYVIIFVCGFAACALILQRTANGVSFAGFSGAGGKSISGVLDDSSTNRPAAAGANSLIGSDLVAVAAAKVEPAVVNIDIEGMRNGKSGPFAFLQGESEAFEGSGSGIILSEDGYVVTNNHVIEPVAERGTEGGNIRIRLDNGKQFDSVSIIGRDPQSDLAVLKSMVQASCLPPCWETVINSE
jgi:putative serine protease PepD